MIRLPSPKQRSRLFLFWLLLATLPAGSGVQAQPRGYQPRACGYDLDFDGTPGEAADCLVCNGLVTDVDGNGVDDVLRYVDCDAGSNSATCGTAQNPCRTVQYALNNRFGSPSAGQIQAVCVKGTCSESLNLSRSGAAGIVTRPPTGSQARSFEYPRYPFIISGWDADGDGSYPPFDTDDTAVFDGDVSGILLDWLYPGDVDRIEVAHLTVQDYHRGSSSASGNLIDVLGGTTDHQSYHDIEVKNWARGNYEYIMLSFFDNGTPSTFASFENMLFSEVGGAFLFRGNQEARSGPVRVQNVTITIFGPNGGGVEALKMWGSGPIANPYFEILDSVWDWNPGAWNERTTGDDFSALVIAQGSQNYVVRNVSFADWPVTILLQPSESSSPQTRALTGLVFDRLDIRTTSNSSHDGCTAHIFTYPTGVGVQHLGDISITNSFFSMTGRANLAGAIRLDATTTSGGDLTGTIRIQGNTFDIDANQGNCTGSGYGVVSILGGSNNQQDVTIEDNYFRNISAGEDPIRIYYTPSNLTLTGNLNDRDDCTANFVSPSTGDYHLRPDDTCLLDRGPVGPCSTITDYDGEERPQDLRCDIGADELASSAPRPSVSILQPSNSSSFSEGETIDFSATATSAQGGDLSTAIAWSSTLDGFIGSGANVSTILSTGTHNVTASVTDGSQSASDSITVIIAADQPPVIQITQPIDGATLESGVPITFTATATDNEDGDLTAGIDWSSDLDGVLGVGGSVSAALSVGVHAVTASVVDSAGQASSDSVLVIAGVPLDCTQARTSTVSSDGGAFPDAQPSKLVDGVWETRDSAWAASGTPRWVEADLGTTVQVVRLRILPFSGSPGEAYYYDDEWTVQYRDSSGALQPFEVTSQFRGSGSLIGPGLTIAGGDPGTSNRDEDFMFYDFAVSPVETRYIRLTILNGDGDGDSNGAELEVCSSLANLPFFADGFESGDTSAWNG